jgi:hypothetical protein
MPSDQRPATRGVDVMKNMTLGEYSYHVEYQPGTPSPLDPSNTDSHVFFIRNWVNGAFCRVPVWHRGQIQQSEWTRKLAEVLQTAYLGGLDYESFADMMQVHARVVDMEKLYAMSQYVATQVLGVVNRDKASKLLRGLKQDGIK